MNQKDSGGPRANTDTGSVDIVIGAGKNPIISHQFTRARVFWKTFSRDSDKILEVIDPELSETAKLADSYLTLRPGTDAFLLWTTVAIILQQGWHDRTFLDEHVRDFAAIRPVFEKSDARAAVEVCESGSEQVEEVCRPIMLEVRVSPVILAS